MILEYQANPEIVWSIPWRADWRGRMSINLAHVIAARPLSFFEGCQVTEVTIQGQIGWHSINVDYEKFCRDWRSVKR